MGYAEQSEIIPNMVAELERLREDNAELKRDKRELEGRIRQMQYDLDHARAAIRSEFRSR